MLWEELGRREDDERQRKRKGVTRRVWGGRDDTAQASRAVDVLKSGSHIQRKGPGVRNINAYGQAHIKQNARHGNKTCR